MWRECNVLDTLLHVNYNEMKILSWTVLSCGVPGAFKRQDRHLSMIASSLMGRLQQSNMSDSMHFCRGGLIILWLYWMMPIRPQQTRYLICKGSIPCITDRKLTPLTDWENKVSLFCQFSIHGLRPCFFNKKNPFTLLLSFTISI